MEELKQGWKKRLSWLFIAITVVVIYKILDNFSDVQAWFGSFFGILKPFLVGILISYILFIPCKKIEKALLKSKSKFMQKKARGLSVIAAYLIFVLIIIIIITIILPILVNSITDLISNIPTYYYSVINSYDNLPEDSLLKTDIIKEQVRTIENIDLKQIVNINGDQVLQYAKNIIGVFSGLLDLFVAVVSSVYILLQRDEIVKGFRRFIRAMFKKETYEAVDKYCSKGNEVFFTFLTCQLLDAFIVAVLTTIAMLILNIKYAPLLGITIGIFNMIPYIGAIVAVGISIIITAITGGIGKSILMAIVIILLQQIDANVINPKILGNSLKTSPLLVLISVAIGGAYFGIVGMFLGVPIAVVIKTVISDYIDAKNKLRDEEEKERNHKRLFVKDKD